MLKSKWFQIVNLQLFAEGGDGAGGDGAGAPGVDADDPGRQALMDLGVPETKIRKKTAHKVTEQLNGRSVRTDPAAAAGTNQQPAAATPVDGAKRMTWDEIMADPEYNQEMQKTVKARVKDSKANEANMKTLAPMLELLAKNYGIDPAKMDYQALSDAVTGDSHYYEEAALDNGRSVEDEMQMSRLEYEARQARQQRETDVRQKFIADHFAKLEQQAEELKQQFPDFDLRTELRNDRFANAVSPSGGLSVKQAFYAFHADEIRAQEAQAVATATARQVSNAIRSGMSRPREAGQSSMAPSTTRLDYSRLPRAKQLEIKREMERRTAQGERVTLG